MWTSALAFGEEMPIFEGLGDKRSRAVTLRDIARIEASRAMWTIALALRARGLRGLGDKRSRAVTLGDIARIRASRAMWTVRSRCTRLAVYEGLGDLDGIANTLWSIARIEIEQEKFQEAYERLQRSYEINLKLGRLDGICMVGVDLGQLLAMGGHREEGLAVLARSRGRFVRLGQVQLAQRFETCWMKLR
ncbi:MAG: hypothetical protein U0610_01550 [bacterium]